MLSIVIPATEQFDEINQVFLTSKAQSIQLEHSLISLTRWESEYCKPFLTSAATLSNDELIGYIRCMTMTSNIDDSMYNCLTKKNVNAVIDYIGRPMTATIFSPETKHPINREIVTGEIIYYWMIALNIPFECQKWHLNRLLTLINVCNIKNQKPKKMSQKELLARNAALNESRKAKLNTEG